MQEEHVHALQQLEQALSLSTNRVKQTETHWNENRNRVTQLEAEQIELCQEVGSCAHDAEGTIARAAGLKNARTRSREEADQSRALTTGSFGKLLDSHSEMRANAELGLNGQSDKITAKYPRLVVDIEELISNGSPASTTAASARVQELEAELAAKTEQIENLESRQINISGDGRSDSSLGDADALARAVHYVK
jgi:multidrug resistance efflux pump